MVHTRWRHRAGESPEQAATREVYEETGLAVMIDDLRTAVGGPDYRTVYTNGDRLSYVTLIYDAHVVGGRPTPDYQETTEVGWFHMRGGGTAGPRPLPGPAATGRCRAVTGAGPIGDLSGCG